MWNLFDSLPQVKVYVRYVISLPSFCVRAGVDRAKYVALTSEEALLFSKLWAYRNLELKILFAILACVNIFHVSK